MNDRSPSTSRPTIRPAVESDAAVIRRINEDAFGGAEEADLVEALRVDGDVLVELVACHGPAVIGHILFSRLAIEGGEAESVPAAALAPMAISPAHQNSGIGSTLVREGLAACRDRGIGAVVVLGHPKYYPRFGFSAANAAHLRAPFSGEAFMSLELVPGALDIDAASVRYAAAFGLADE